MMEKHSLLISISIDLIAGQAKLKEIVTSLETLGPIVSTSSIYKKFLNRRAEDLNSELVMVLKIETDKYPEDIYQFIKDQQKIRNETRSNVQLILLVYDQMVRLLPGQNLPSPLLHNDSLTLRCASEAWGDYEHPVLGQKLNELVRSSQPLPHVEFFAQGRGLLSSETL